MNNNIFYSVSLSLGVVATIASCTKTEVGSYAPQSEGVTISITAPETRVGVDGLDVYWEEGDQMLFYGSATKANGGVSLSVSEVNGSTATFTGTLGSTVTGRVSGFYPNINGLLNNGANAAMSLSSLRIFQPSYFRYTYTDGKLDPSSMGDYCFMHFQADQDSASDGSTLTGAVEHLMAYVDFNLENPKAAVQKVYITMDEPLTYPSMKVAADGTCTMDPYIDYIYTTTEKVPEGATSDYAKVNMDNIVVELTDTATNEFGVTAGEDNIIPIRIPFIPQHLVGKWSVFVQYVDGSEDVVRIKYPLVILAAGKVSNMNSTIDLSSATHLETKTPKLGDYYYADGTYSSVIDETKDLTNLGIVYELLGTGVDTKISKVYAALAGVSAKVVDTATYPGYKLIVKAATADYEGLINLSNLVKYGRDYAIENNVADITEESTIAQVCDKMYPAFSATMNRNSNLEYMSLDGTETGVWYIPSYFEIYRMNSDVNALQGLRTLYYQEQMARLPEAFTTQTGYTSVLPLTAANYQYLSSTISTAFAWRYVRQRMFHFFDPTRDTFYTCSYMTQATGAAAYRPIMKVNVAE